MYDQVYMVYAFRLNSINLHIFMSCIIILMVGGGGHESIKYEILCAEHEQRHFSFYPWFVSLMNKIINKQNCDFAMLGL